MKSRLATSWRYISVSLSLSFSLLKDVTFLFTDLCICVFLVEDEWTPFPSTRFFLPRIRYCQVKDLPFNDMPGIRMLLEDCQSRVPRIRRTRERVSPRIAGYVVRERRGRKKEKYRRRKRTHLPPGFRSQYEASCQKEIVSPFYLVAPKNVMKSVFARKSRIGSESAGNKM